MANSPVICYNHFFSSLMLHKLNFDNLTTEQKIGQMFIISLPHAELDSEAREILKTVKPGGICLFARNIRTAEQTRRLLDECREILDFEPFLTLDQEGGLVDRLRRVITPMPAPKNLSTVEQFEKLARITAQVIRILGFNMNYAPVVDVINEERAQFVNGLYARNFGFSKDDVVRFALPYMKALKEGGVVGCLKHFPGLGASKVDSHDKLPFIRLSREEIFDTDLYPYMEFFKDGNGYTVMIGHAVYTAFENGQPEDEMLPASLSPNVIDGLLRGELGFDRLVITDDLEMSAVSENYRMGRAAVLAIKAGNDCVSFCSNPEILMRAHSAVTEAVKTGEIPESRLDASIRRIAETKKLLQPPLEFDESKLQALSAEVQELNDQCC